jgi:hypothetical protein
MGYSLFVKKYILIFSILLFIVLAAAPSYYFYRKYQTLQKQVGSSAQKDDIAALTARVAKHILLPTGETPTVMTVTDKEKLSGQLFFANSKNGDKVLVYEKAKKAFLYDPDADRVIEVGPIVVTASASGTLTSAAPSPTPQASYTFALLNATLVSGLTKTYEATLISKVPAARVVARGNAKGDYTESLLVDVTGTHKDEAVILAKTLGLEVSSLPAGEATPSSDFIIILGNDQK